MSEFVPLTEEDVARINARALQLGASVWKQDVLALLARLTELTAGCKMPPGGWGDRATCIHEIRLAEAERERDEWKRKYEGARRVGGSWHGAWYTADAENARLREFIAKHDLAYRLAEEEE